jgi:hypothetical protein
MAMDHKQLEDDDVISYILSGLEAKYNGLGMNVNSRSDTILMSNLFAQILAAEERIKNQNHATLSANAATRGGGNFHGRGGRNGGCWGCGPEATEIPGSRHHPRGPT